MEKPALGFKYLRCSVAALQEKTTAGNNPSHIHGSQALESYKENSIQRGLMAFILIIKHLHNGHLMKTIY